MTTDEIDGLMTQEDKDNRFKVVFQCMSCNKWTVFSNWKPWERNSYRPCDNCGEINYGSSSIKSFRSYNPEIDNKRRPGKKSNVKK